MMTREQWLEEVMEGEADGVREDTRHILRTVVHIAKTSGVFLPSFE